MKIKKLLAACAFVPCICIAAPIVNDGSFYSVNWSSSTLAGYGTTTGSGGTSPSVTGGDLTLSMVGATAGSTEVRKVNMAPPTYPILTDYVVTTRASVAQFSGASGNGNTQYITLANILSYDNMSIGVNSTQVLVLGASGGTAINLSSLGLVNDPNTFYTWQFEVHQNLGSGAGTVSIYRRDNDSGDPWDVIALNVSILNYTLTPTATNIYFGRVTYSPSGNQGILQQEYFKVAAVPEPGAAVLFAFGLGMVVFWHRSHWRTRAR